MSQITDLAAARQVRQSNTHNNKPKTFTTRKLEWLTCMAADLRPWAFQIMFWLSTHINEKTETAYPSEETLADFSGSPIRTVRRALKQARDRGWLKCQRRPNASNVYTPLFDRVPETLAQIKAKREKRRAKYHTNGIPDRPKLAYPDRPKLASKHVKEEHVKDKPHTSCAHHFEQNGAPPKRTPGNRLAIIESKLKKQDGLSIEEIEEATNLCWSIVNDFSNDDKIWHRANRLVGLLESESVP